MLSDTMILKKSVQSYLKSKLDKVIRITFQEPYREYYLLRIDKMYRNWWDDF